MTQRTLEPIHAESDDNRDRAVVAESSESTVPRTSTAKKDPEPPYLPGYYLG